MDTIQHQTPAPAERHSAVERAVEALLFSSAFSATGDGITVGILGLVDISLRGNLLVMVIVAG